jgi:hypothetical protein
LNFDRFKFTGLKAHATFDTFFGVDLKRFSCLFLRFLFAGDRLHWTDLCTSSTPRTYIRENAILKESSADLCWTSFIEDVFLVFFPEIPDGREDRIRSRPS